MQTGGAKKNWLFATNELEEHIGMLQPIRDQLIHYDTYFDEEYDTNTLAIVLDFVLDALPEELAECVRLVYLEGRSYREVGRTVGVDHKTAKARAQRGVELMRERLVDSVWIAEMLRGYIPKDEFTPTPVTSSTKVVDVLGALKGVGS